MAQTPEQSGSAIFKASDTFRWPAELRDIKIIAVEEHISCPDILGDLGIDNHASQRLGSRMGQIGQSYAGQRLTQASHQRLQDMDVHGVAVQILGLSSAINTTHLVGANATTALRTARDVNNELKKVVDANPTRFRAFAELPMHQPEEAARELHRCVTELGFVGAMLSGSVSGDGTFLDAPQFAPLLSAFEELEVPLFLHPGVPPRAVWDAYYNLPGKPEMSVRFGLGGWGWHNEVGIHVLRLVLSGTLQRHPALKIIIGHQGEMIPFMMQRLEDVFDSSTFGLQRTVGETLRAQVWIALSGFFSLPLTQLSIATWGADRILFGVDYPFSNMNKVPEYVRALGSLISPGDLRKILQTNAQELLKVNFQADG